MKIYLLSLLLFLCCINVAFGQVSKDSLKYCRTGTFRYQGAFSDIEIKRTDKIQTEYNHDKSDYLKLKVQWVSPDEYWLIYIKSKNEPVTYEAKHDTLKVKITSADRHKYSCHFTEGDKSGDCTFTKEQ